MAEYCYDYYYEDSSEYSYMYYDYYWYDAYADITGYCYYDLNYYLTECYFYDQDWQTYQSQHCYYNSAYTMDCCYDNDYGIYTTYNYYYGVYNALDGENDSVYYKDNGNAGWWNQSNNTGLYYTASSGKYYYLYLNDKGNYQSSTSTDDSDSSQMEFCYYSYYMVPEDYYICGDLISGYMYTEDTYTGQETYYDANNGDYEVYSYYYGAENFYNGTSGDWYQEN